MSYSVEPCHPCSTLELVCNADMNMIFLPLFTIVLLLETHYGVPCTRRILPRGFGKTGPLRTHEMRLAAGDAPHQLLCNELASTAKSRQWSASIAWGRTRPASRYLS